jgi:hypothetical protein
MRLTILLFVLLICSAFGFAQTTNPVALIRKTVEAINNEKDYKIKTLDNVYFADEKNEAADNGQELKGYYKNGRLKKIVYSLGLSYCMKTFEYYFSDTGLVFVFEIEADYPETKTGLDQSKLVPAFAGRYYIEKGKIIQTIIKGKTRTGVDDTGDMMGNLKDLLEDLKTAKGK